MKKIVALLLSLLLFFTASVAMAETTVTVARGGKVSMDISISSASGTTAKIGIKTNSAPVTFVSAVGGSVNDTIPPQDFSDYFVVVNIDGVSLLPDGSDYDGAVGDYTMSNLEDGVIGTLTFKVNADAKLGTYTVSAYKKSGSCTVTGSVKFTVTDRLPGDANDDGEVTTRDALVIMQWIAGFPGVTINEANANCNGDDEVTTRDALVIMQWIAGFPGVELQ